MFLYLARPESSRIFCCKVYKRVSVVFRLFFPGVFCESVVFTEVRRRSRSVGGGRVYSGVTEVTSEASTEVEIVTEKLRVFGGGRKVTKVKCSYKPC